MKSYAIIYLISHHITSSDNPYHFILYNKKVVLFILCHIISNASMASAQKKKFIYAISWNLVSNITSHIYSYHPPLSHIMFYFSYIFMSRYKNECIYSYVRYYLIGSISHAIKSGNWKDGNKLRCLSISDHIFGYYLI